MGLVASALVDIPGVSEIFHEGYVTYSNDAKERLLGVAPKPFPIMGWSTDQTLPRWQRVPQKNGSYHDVALSSTGVAGPDGGTKDIR